MNSKNCKIGAVVLTVILIGTAFFVPASSVNVENVNYTKIEEQILSNQVDVEVFKLDRSYHINSPVEPLNNNDNDDAGHKRDAGNTISKRVEIYPGEMEDNWPGRGRTGKLNPDAEDEEDWYEFSVGLGQDIFMTLTPPSGHDYDLALYDKQAAILASSTNSGSTPESLIFTSEYTGRYYMQVKYISGSGEGQYTFDVEITSQNDAGSGDDAGDSFATATSISPGEYFGYIDMNDGEDWYKFNVAENDGIHVDLEMTKSSLYSDFDIYLYSPDEEFVYCENYYYDDELLYPAFMAGEWRIKICAFPGYNDIPQPTEWEYFTYSSGAYEFLFEIVDNAPSPPDPIIQPAITPIAQTFIVNNDKNSNKDEFGYMAAIPACNYLQGGNRYVAPIVYEGDTTPTEWFGTVDDTTDYLLNDWNNYLAADGKESTVYNIDSDPIKAASDIAMACWESSDLAVVAVDGSDYEDTTEQALLRTKTLTRSKSVKTIHCQSNDLVQIGAGYSYPMLLGPKWGAISVEIIGSNKEPYLSFLYPGYMPMGDDWWPEHVDKKTDIYHPISTSGYWAASVGDIKEDDDFNIRITTLNSHRYSIKVDNSDSALSVKITTTTPSDLLVFLVDPQGWVRAPDIPDWNGGEINPIHEWNGIDDPAYPPDCDNWESWIVEPHTEFSAEVLHPEKGEWTAIVVPRYATGSPTKIKYTITGTIREINKDRAHAALSAANAAVIASQEHVPLLYVKEDKIPDETKSAFNTLGVKKVIFVQLRNIGAKVQGSLPKIDKNLQTMQQTVDFIKNYPHSENYIPITSLKSGMGYYAPTAYLAAYHCAPILRIYFATEDTTVKYNPVIVGLSGYNAYIYDTKTNQFTWSYPEGWQPTDSNLKKPANSVCLGSANDIIFAVNPSDWSLIWTNPMGYENSEFNGESIYYSPETTEVIFTDVDEDEPYMEPLDVPIAKNPAGMANRIDTWRLWAGDYYHGNRAPGHLPVHDEPIDIENVNLVQSVLKYLLTGEGELPPFGLDAKRYWNEAMHNGIYEMILGFGLDEPGQEAYVFVSNRKDIRIETHAVMIGKNSYAGHIPGKTPSYANDIIIRNVLYPALIYANPNRDITTAQMMNYPDCLSWTTNDNVNHKVCSSRTLKKFFGSHGRKFEGHTLWEAHLERLNEGASVFYYSGHGTGGSGMSSQYIQTDFCNYPEIDWFDAWRGYMYDNWNMPRDTGFIWYNPEPPNLYDIVHYKWIDQLLENLRSLAVFYMSCSTGQQFGPLVYLDHGAVMWYGNAGSGLCPEADLMDDWFFEDALVHGLNVGEAYSQYVWLHYRDFTDITEESMYGPSSLRGFPAEDGITTVHCIYGDPNLILYSPDWEPPSPIDANIVKSRSRETHTPRTIRDVILDFIQDFLKNHPILQKILLSQPIIAKLLQH